LAVTNGSNDAVSILLGKGDGTFKDPVSFGVDRAPVSVAVGDFNVDGLLDLAVANFRSEDISVLINNTGE
jgi:FG-GAP-like repeat